MQVLNSIQSDVQLKPIYWEQSEDTPKIILDSQRNIFQISGISFPPNPLLFYRPVLKWVKEYSENPNQETNVEISLEYFSMTSAKCLLDFLLKLKHIHNSGYKVVVGWKYDEQDDQMLEAGTEYSELLEMPFNFSAKKL